jgi:hypothetical protein
MQPIVIDVILRLRVEADGSDNLRLNTDSPATITAPPGKRLVLMAESAPETQKKTAANACLVCGHPCQGRSEMCPTHKGRWYQAKKRGGTDLQQWIDGQRQKGT